MAAANHLFGNPPMAHAQNRKQLLMQECTGEMQNEEVPHLRSPGPQSEHRLQPTQRRDILENRGNMANIYLGKNCSEDYFGILARSPQRGRRGRAVSIRPEGTRVEVT